MSLSSYRFTLKDQAAFAEISDQLLELGVCSISIINQDDLPIFSTNEEQAPLWDNMLIEVLSNQDEVSSEEIINLLQAIDKEILISKKSVKTQDWQDKWLAETTSIIINEKLAIVPSHIKPKKEHINVKLTPGIAFGTGSHPTTFMCLDWLSKADLAGKTVLDFGCGSGILGIASVLLGANYTLAVDNDTQAVTAAKANFINNNIANEKYDIKTTYQLAESKFDLILANIYQSVLCEHAQNLLTLLSKHGVLILTGILQAQEKVIIEAYSDCKITKIVHHGEWSLIVVRLSK